MKRVGLIVLCLLLAGLAGGTAAASASAAVAQVSAARAASANPGKRQLCRKKHRARGKRCGTKRHSARQPSVKEPSDVPSASPPTNLPPLQELIAPETACPGQSDETLPAASQEATMECMINFARAKAGDPGLSDVAVLDASSEAKAADITRCAEFSHTACGRAFTYWFEQDGYGQPGGCWSAGENIAWGTGELGTVRSILTAWVHSPEHLANMLESSFAEFGVGMVVGPLSGFSGAHVWVTHFGKRC